MSQFDLFGVGPVSVPVMPTADSIRPRVEAVLNQLSEASELPWTAEEERRWKLVLPQMAEWLPQAERDEVRARFWSEIDRLQTQAA